MIIREMEKIYAEYSTELYRYLLSLTHSPTEEEDLPSETFIQALKNIGSFRGDSTIRTRLYSIERNVWLVFVKKSRDILNIDDMLELYIDDSILDTVSTGIMAAFIKEQLTKMGQRSQNIVLMRSRGYSYNTHFEVLMRHWTDISDKLSTGGLSEHDRLVESRWNTCCRMGTEAAEEAGAILKTELSEFEFVPLYGKELNIAAIDLCFSNEEEELTERSRKYRQLNR